MMTKVVVFIIAFLITLNARAELSGYALGGWSYANPKVSGELEQKIEREKHIQGLTGGLGLDLDLLVKSLGLQFELGYMRNGYTRNGIEVSMQWLVIPAQLRLRLTFLTFVAGGYYAKGLGKISARTSSEQGNIVDYVAKVDWDKTQFAQNDQGLTAGVYVNLKQFFFGARVLRGMKNIGGSTSELKNTMYSGVLGVYFW